MGHGADVRDQAMDKKEKEKNQAINNGQSADPVIRKEQQAVAKENQTATDQIKAAQKENSVTATSPTAGDPYGGLGMSSQAVRRRGEVGQQRVNNDTRVREDASSGTAGATGQSIGNAMSESQGAQQQAQQAQQNYQPQQSLWQGSRQPVDLASVQQRVLQSINGINNGGGM